MPFYLGPAGALVQLPDPDGVDPTLVRRGGSHSLLSGGIVRDTLGYRRVIRLTWSSSDSITAAELSTLENLFLLGGPLIYLDPSRQNLLTANQATGTDFLDDATGFSAPFQGTVASDTTQKRSGARSLKWDTVTSLSVTNRGVWLPALAGGTPDSTWAAVLPSTVYSFSAYVRASAAITMYSAIDWRDATGAAVGSTDFGTPAAVSTTDWTTRLTVVNKTSPATAAYAVPSVLDSTAPSAIRQVWIDDPQLEQAAAASAWVEGTGTPRVVFDALTSQLLWLNPSPYGAQYTAEATLVEL